MQKISCICERIAGMAAPAVLWMSALVLAPSSQAQEWYQSSLDGGTYEVRQPDGLSFALYGRDGSLLASLSRKKASDRFKGVTYRLAPTCPEGKGKIEVVEIGATRIRMRVEKPQGGNSQTCMMPLLVEWNNFDLIKGGAGGSAPVAAAGGAPNGDSQNPQRTRTQERATQVAAMAAGQAGGSGQGLGDAIKQAVSRLTEAANRGSAKQELVYHTFVPSTGDVGTVRYGGLAKDQAGHAYVGYVCEGFPGVAKLDKSGKFFHFRTAVVSAEASKDFCQEQGPRLMSSTPEAEVKAVGVAPDGASYMAGVVRNAYAFPTVNAVRPKPVGEQAQQFGTEGFLVRISGDGKRIEFATLWGGLGDDAVNGLAVDPDGGVWVVGTTKSKDFPRVSPLFDFQGYSDAFVTYFDASGKPRFSSTIGSDSTDQGTAIAVAKSSVFVAGVADGSAFPTSEDAIGKTPFHGKAFLAKIGKTTRRLEYLSRLGYGTYQFAMVPAGVGVDGSGQVVIAGHTQVGPMFPNVNDPDRSTSDRLKGAGVLLRLNPDLKTYNLVRILGDENPAKLFGVSVTPGGTIYAAGAAEAMHRWAGWPKMRTGEQGQQGFVLKYDPDGTQVWSSALGAATEPRAGWTYGADPEFEVNYATAIAADESEVTVLSKSGGIVAPTTVDVLIGEGTPPNRRILEELHGGYTVAKYRPTGGAPGPCTFWTRPMNLYFTNQGGQDFKPWVVTNRADCKWKVSTQDSWIRVKPVESTQGINLLKLDVESNYDARRTGKVQVMGEGGQTFTLEITQSTVPLEVSVSRAYVELSSRNAGSTMVDVQGDSAAEWAITTDASWIKVDGPASRKGPGKVTIRTVPNTTGAPRSAYLMIGSRRVTVMQGTDDIPAEGGEAGREGGKPARIAAPAAAPKAAPAGRIAIPKKK